MSLKDELIQRLEENNIETIRNEYNKKGPVKSLIPPLHEDETKKVKEAKNPILKIIDLYMRGDYNGQEDQQMTPFMVTDVLLLETHGEGGNLYSKANTEADEIDFRAYDPNDSSQDISNHVRNLESLGTWTHGLVQSPGIRRMALLKRTSYKVTEVGDDFIIKCNYELQVLDDKFALLNKEGQKYLTSELEMALIESLAKLPMEEWRIRNQPYATPLNLMTEVIRKSYVQDALRHVVDELFSPSPGGEKFTTCAVMNKECAELFVYLHVETDLDPMVSYDARVRDLASPFGIKRNLGVSQNRLANRMEINFLTIVPYLHEILKPSLMTQAQWFARHFNDEHRESELSIPMHNSLTQRDYCFGEGGENFTDEYIIKLKSSNGELTRWGHEDRLPEVLRKINRMNFTQMIVDGDSDKASTIESKAIKMHNDNQTAELPVVSEALSMHRGEEESLLSLGNLNAVRLRDATNEDAESLKTGKTVFDRLTYPDGKVAEIAVTQSSGLRIGVNRTIHTIPPGVWQLQGERLTSAELLTLDLRRYYRIIDETKNWAIIESKSRLGRFGNAPTTERISLGRRGRKMNPSEKSDVQDTSPTAIRRRRRTLTRRNEEE